MKRWLVFYKDLWKILVHVTSCCIDLRQGIWCLTLAGTAAWLPPSLLCLEICWRKILVDFYLFWPSGHFGSSWNWFIHTLEGWFLLLQFSLTMCHFWNTLVSMYSMFFQLTPTKVPHPHHSKSSLASPQSQQLWASSVWSTCARPTAPWCQIAALSPRKKKTSMTLTERMQEDGTERASMGMGIKFM